MTSVGPASGATSVYPNTVVYEVFSSPMNQAATQAAFSLGPTGGGGPVSGKFSWYGPTLMIFTPNGDLGTGVQYTASVSTAAKDQSGNALSAAMSWRFTTINQPIIDSLYPATGAAGVGTNSPVVAIFSEAMDHPSTQAAFTLTRTSNNTPVAGSILWYGDRAPIFFPASPLAANTTYTATIAGTAKDQSGRTLANPTSWTFTTGTAAASVARAFRWSTPSPSKTHRATRHTRRPSRLSTRQRRVLHPVSDRLKQLERGVENVARHPRRR